MKKFDVIRNTLFSRAVISLIILTAVMPAFSTAVSTAFIEGYVTDKDTGRPFEKVLVETFNVSDHTNPVTACETDKRGYYNMSVPPGNYDVYVRVGKSNPTQSVYVQGGEIQTINFKVRMESVVEDIPVETLGFGIVIAIAILIVIVIAIDQLFLKKKRSVEGSATEKPKETLEDLEKEKAQIDHMIELTRQKYHQRKINEESFREIIRDYQEKLIEIEAKIAAAEKEGE